MNFEVQFQYQIVPKNAIVFQMLLFEKPLTCIGLMKL